MTQPVGLLCSESPISLTVIRELGMRGIPVLAIVREAHSFLKASRYTAGSILRPEGPVASWLPGLAADHRFERVMAIGEADLLALAEMKHAGSGLQIAAPTPDQLRLVLDKQALLSAASVEGIPVPRSWQPSTPDSSEWLPDDAQFPLVAKWSDPLAVADRLAETGIALDKVRYLADEAALAAYLERFIRAGMYPLIQEFCPGTGLGQMFHAVDGRITLRFQHRRLREWPLSGGVSSLCEAVPLSQHEDLGVKSEALLRKLHWNGPAMVEYRHDEKSGATALMEINGRFWGSLPLAHAAGVHFGWETYRHAFDAPKGLNLSPSPYPHRKARYMAPELKNLSDVFTSERPLAEKFGFLRQFASSFFDPAVRYYVFTARDPGPFFSELKTLVRKLLRRDGGG